MTLRLYSLLPNSSNAPRPRRRRGRNSRHSVLWTTPPTKKTQTPLHVELPRRRGWCASWIGEGDFRLTIRPRGGRYSGRRGWNRGARGVPEEKRFLKQFHSGYIDPA